jgi:GAF domain-containing protein
MDEQTTQPLSALAERWRARRADLVVGCMAALDAANLTTHRYLPPQEHRQVAEQHVDALLAALAAGETADPGAVRKQGNAFVEAGFSDNRTVTTLRTFWVAQVEVTSAPDQTLPTLRFVHRYLDLFAEGFQRGRDRVILRQQEKMRMALEETLTKAQAEGRRLTRELQDRLTEVNALNRLLTGKAWRRFAGARTMPREITWTSATSDGSTRPPSSDNRVVIPLTLRGKQVAQVEIERDPSRPWRDEDARLIQALAPQLAQALDSARLFDETQRRAVPLRAAAEVARDATAILDVNQLLDETVHLISGQFGFYHAGVFLLDERGEYAVLQAASSEGGGRMLERGHKLQVGKVGIVGYVSDTGEPRIALDVDEDAAHFASSDLPDTRSEMALPLKVRGRVIGVLDVQSTQEAAFSEDDVAVLQTLADQLATAIENARLFEQAQRRVRRERLIREITAKVVSSTNLDTVLKTTAQELGKALGTSHAVVRLGAEAEGATASEDDKAHPIDNWGEQEYTKHS